MNDWKLKPLIPTYDIENNDFWYDLTMGGYIKIEDYLSDGSQINKLEDAINIVRSFERLLEENCSTDEDLDD
jgi:hypothetical protein